MAKKADNAQKELRITEVYRLIVNGADRAAIHDYAAKKEWGIETRQIDNYRKAAYTRLKAHADAERAIELGLARARLNQIFAKAFSLNDIKTALQAQAEINKLEGLYAPPAARTLKLIGLDAGELAELAQLLDANGLNAHDVFAAMKARLTSDKQGRNEP